jgi:hypothetical protein
MNNSKSNVLPLKLRQNEVDDDLKAFLRSLNKYFPSDLKNSSYKSFFTEGGFDRLELKTEESINWEWIRENCIERHARCCNEYNFSKNYIVKGRRNTKFTVRSKPKNIKHTSPNQLKIEFNPNQFTQYKVYKKYLRKILGPQAARNHKVTRLDMSLLFLYSLFPFDFFKMSLWMNESQSFKDDDNNNSYNSTKQNRNRNGREIIYGALPLAVAIYERPAVGIMDSLKTNLEIRMWNEKIEEVLGITNAFQLNKIQPDSFLNNLKFYNVFEFRLINLSYSEKQNVLDLISNVKEKGFQLGKKETIAYRNNQFDRYYTQKKILKRLTICKEKIPLNAFLEFVIKKNMKKFFLIPEPIKRKTKDKNKMSIADELVPIFNVKPKLQRKVVRY